MQVFDFVNTKSEKRKIMTHSFYLLLGTIETKFLIVKMFRKYYKSKTSGQRRREKGRRCVKGRSQLC